MKKELDWLSPWADRYYILLNKIEALGVNTAEKIWDRFQ